MNDGWDVVVVGAGSAGCALAGRLSEDPGRRVLVLEAGPAPTGVDGFAPEVLRAASLAAADPAAGHAWAFPTELAPGRIAVVGRGRLLGGSSAINGANHLRAVPADVDAWPGWSYAEAVAYYVRGETDLDVRAPYHGDRGPVPVVRPAGELLAPVTERFLDAAWSLGVPDEADKNAGGPPGVGLMPGNVSGGLRVNAAIAYLLPHRGRENLVVRGETTVTGLEFAHDRVIGVRTREAGVVHAGEVVLAAGSVKSPQLLAVSGIGPADELRAAGIAVRADRPGVGHGFSDHGCVYLPLGREAEYLHPDAPSAQAAAHLDAGIDGGDPAGDLEILLFARPFAPGGPAHLMCALQRPEARGAMTVRTPDVEVAPRIAHRYLESASDRARMRHGVRVAGDLLRTGGLGALPEEIAGAADHVVDGWIRTHLTTSAHLCGSAALGSADDPMAVVDASLRVHGVPGLRVVDTSVLPAVPRRGPAATALMLGERAADLIGASRT